MAKQDTIKFLNQKVRNTGDISDYERIPFGVDSVNVDRPNGGVLLKKFLPTLTTA